MMTGEPIVFDDPDNVCFGCSPRYGLGLQLRFARAGVRAAESRDSCPPHRVGATGEVLTRGEARWRQIEP